MSFNKWIQMGKYQRVWLNIPAKKEIKWEILYEYQLKIADVYNIPIDNF